jgi:D-lactate dehydrogenase (cytochrome)
MIPFGSGTSLEGYIKVLYGGIRPDFSRMNQVFEVNENDLDYRTQAGVPRKQLNVHLRLTNLLFLIDPGSDASTGGMTATQTSGTMRSATEPCVKMCWD